MGTYLAIFQARYNRNLDRNVPRTLQFQPGQHVVIDRLRAEMNNSAHIGNALLGTLPPNLGPIEVIFAVMDTVTVDGNCMNNTFFIDSVTLAH